MTGIYQSLREINRRPTCFERTTAADLWTDEHISSRMLALHLDGSVDVSSRRTDFLDRSAAWMIDRFGLGPGKAVVDFGCGPGLYTSRLAASGAAVTGIDFSERSIRYARALAQRQGLSIEHIQADYLRFEPEGIFDLITMIMGDYCALSPDQRSLMLDKFRAHLRPGGNILFDVYSLAALGAREETASYGPGLQDGFWSPHPYFGFLNTFRYESARVVLDKYTIVEEARTRTVYNWLQYFDRQSLAAEAESCDLVVEEVLGDVAGASYDPTSHEFAVVLAHP
jgi:cyclopropane fatty-acyl-phospholipid synthase-like methyltransferase